MALKIRRGSDTVRQTITPSEGELLYTTDTKKIFVGDGATLGGTEVSGVNVGTTNAIAYYAEPGQAVSSTDNLTWDDTNNLLTVDKGLIGITNENIKRDMLVLSQHYSSSFEGSSLSFIRSRGSKNYPAALLAQDTLGAISFNGFHTGSTNFDLAAGITSYIPTPPTLDGSTFAIEFVSKTGTGPCYVTFSFVTQGVAPTPSKSYTIAGNENTAYNGSWRVFSSTTSQMVMFYITDPGVYGAGSTTAKLDGIVVGSLALQTRTSNGNIVRAIRVENNGLTIIGPTQPDYVISGALTKPYDPTHNGQLAINTTVTSVGQGSLDAQLTLRTYANTTYSQSLNINRFRGTIAYPTSLVSGDQIHFIKWLGSTGTTGTTNTAAALSVTVDDAVAAGKVPGAITISTTNTTSGSLVAAVKIDSVQQTTFYGNVKHSALDIISPNYITISSTGPYTLSATVSTNILLVTANTFTATLNMPASPIDGQVCVISISGFSINLQTGTGTVLPTFAGSSKQPGQVFKYVYRTSNTTWYQIG
jgi:hypothetical protein